LLSCVADCCEVERSVLTTINEDVMMLCYCSECLSVCTALAFQSLDLESLFLVCR